MKFAILVENLAKDYGRLQALKGVSFTIQPGEIFALLGPNGAGKSTLINILAGLVLPTLGHASIMGHDVVADAIASKRHLGVVPQEIVQDVFFTVRQLLQVQAGYFGMPWRESNRWIDELLERLGLADKAHVTMRQLSGGMKRRLMVAMAMAHRPPVLVLDEPTAGVDIELRKALWEFVRAWHRAGNTVVLTTHYLQEAEALCDRIAILNQGELVALDTKKALLARHPHRILHLTFGRALDILPVSLREFVTMHSADKCIWSLKLPRQEGAIQTILTTLTQEALSLVDLSVTEPGLEDVFLSLTSGSKVGQSNVRTRSG